MEGRAVSGPTQLTHTREERRLLMLLDIALAALLLAALAVALNAWQNPHA